MATRRFTGKTVDEATDLALETLELNQEEVEIVVVNPGRSGILGFGGEPAEIHVTPLIAEKTEPTRTSASSASESTDSTSGDADADGAGESAGQARGDR